jgi:hypothetical protein
MPVRRFLLSSARHHLLWWAYAFLSSSLVPGAAGRQHRVDAGEEHRSIPEEQYTAVVRERGVFSMCGMGECAATALEFI